MSWAKKQQPNTSKNRFTAINLWSWMICMSLSLAPLNPPNAESPYSKSFQVAQSASAWILGHLKSLWSMPSWLAAGRGEPSNPASVAGAGRTCSVHFWRIKCFPVEQKEGPVDPYRPSRRPNPLSKPSFLGESTIGPTLRIFAKQYQQTIQNQPKPALEHCKTPIFLPLRWPKKHHKTPPILSLFSKDPPAGRWP